VGTIPVTPTIVAGSQGTAAQINAICDVIDFWASSPKCYAYCTSGPSLTTAVAAVIPLGGEKYDVVNTGDSPGHDLVTNNSRVVAQTGGKYEIVGQVTFASNVTGDRQVQTRINSAGAVAGGTLVVLARTTAISGALPVSTPPVTVDLAAGDYIEMFALQSSGGALSVTASDPANTWLQIRLVGS